MNKLSPGLNFTVLCGVSAVLWFRPLLDTFTLAATDERYTDIILILPLTAALILRDWKDRRVAPQRWAPAGGILVVAILIMVIARVGTARDSDIGLAVEIASLVIWWIASFVFSFGLPSFRLFRFPLLFLLWMVPLPKIVMDPIVEGLQRGSILAAQFLFSAFRVPVFHQGITIFIPGLDIAVTPDCSSIRSSLMLLVTTMLLVHVLLKHPWRKALVIAIAVPLSVAKNGLRIFVIGMLSTRVDRGFLTGHLHRQGGIIFFLIALAVVFLFLWILRRGERTPALPPQLGPAPF
jgi:exosortase